MDDKIIGQKLKELRASMNMTQKEFGDLINIAQTTLSSYENDSKTPNIETLYSIAEKCNISIDWLCGLSKIKNTNTFINYPDIFRVLVNMSSAVNTSFLERYYNNELLGYELSFGNTNVDEFITKWQKIKSLYDEKVIDQDTYKTIMESIIDKSIDKTLAYYGDEKKSAWNFDINEEDINF